jgi:hypothetical protein
LDSRSIVFLFLPSIGFLTVAIALIVTGTHLRHLLSKPLINQRERDARYDEIQKRLSTNDATLTPEKTVSLLRGANRSTEGMKQMAADIAGYMRAFGLLALVPLALQVYVIIRVAATRPKVGGRGAVTASTDH